ncbi:MULTISPECIES: class I SAM-dependent methyltransferase [Spirulina sp. CCY15215]|uniref:class I SAM-dependent methyltransferase n=1 Tax=Spirulina sp. CCY15215 TaxID=2767591 RepID=UPI0019503A4E|nr:class I SAM-dependent methyltransferase [Spirulina major]
MKLEQVVPWGRSLDNYINMFHLTRGDFRASILDCAGGPSSFNTEMTQQQCQVISCDPIYQFRVEEIRQRIEETYPVIIEKLAQNFAEFVWQEIDSPKRLGDLRMAAMEQFLADLEKGIAEKRYIVAELPDLPFGDRQFDLALCGHFLFSYSEQFSLEFHLDAIREMCRIAKEVRIFPIVENFTGVRSWHLDPLQAELTAQGYQIRIEGVNYEFQKGGNEMMRVCRI